MLILMPLLSSEIKWIKSISKTTLSIQLDYFINIIVNQKVLYCYFRKKLLVSFSQTLQNNRLTVLNTKLSISLYRKFNKSFQEKSFTKAFQKCYCELRNALLKHNHFVLYIFVFLLWVIITSMTLYNQKHLINS